MLNKKGESSTITIIIAIVLGIAVLVFLIFGFTSGWNNLWDRISNLGGGSANLDTIVSACSLACDSQNTYDFCERKRTVKFGESVEVKYIESGTGTESDPYKWVEKKSKTATGTCKQFALGKIDEYRATLTAGLRAVILFSVPASVGLILLRQPIVSMLFEGGQFTMQSTEMVAWSLLWYAAGLVGHAVLEVLARAFYALHDTKTPVLVGAGAMTINVALSFLFAALFDRIGWMPHGGLALANSTATALEAILLLILIRRRIESLHIKEIGRGFIQALICVSGMTLGLWLWSSFMTSLPIWIIAIGGVIVGFTAYGLMGILLRIPEFHSLTRSVRRQLRF